MSRTITSRAAVALTAGKVDIVEIEIPAPTGRQILIDVAACGLCGSDLHFIDGTSGTAFPYLLGHEVSGTVREIGADVTKFAVGDQVIGALVVACQECKDCERGRPKACRFRKPVLPHPTLEDGRELTPVLGIGGLADVLLIDQLHLTKLPDGLELELGALLGCGVSTGFGAAANTGEVRPGDRVAVIGAGGVGLAAIAGAHASGADAILALDRDRTRFDRAKQFGATHTAAPEDISGGIADDQRYDVVIDCVGGAGPLQMAIDLLQTGGRIVMPGAPRRDEEVTLAMRTLFDRRVEFTVCHLGDCVPDEDMPRIAALAADGSFPLELYRSETVGLEDAPAAYERMRRGEVLRSIVVPSRDRRA
ncbi:S-(hydroxymethyl)mycothiol dehydrogenase [Rhodococcus sp. PAMC28707]|uniref:alcohol dehydrogenase catalytic domain-containing protein n=1 Tax=unclassified Rhodococcus (in: high G+C Gram-positive bacteria) TaxID=192944 RepID=UPI00109DD00A|nr:MULTISPECIES: alcohol dehydrogenase catalytic domain-containing protein [unclassified Rhodococcus (in: high G+C Gram-positive bacteria)]QCB51594.1 S-(hydroxymethyl)mycothiol dehydrogenase [Rhodococcus sp. PAMC28705]QCB60238.1 S-(hydroxymethyl)mycothiol dehydrogenase [Rhodococcus sp. PAMC28707]